MSAFNIYFDGGVIANQRRGYGSYEITQKKRIPFQLKSTFPWSVRDCLFQFDCEHTGSTFVEYVVMVRSIKRLMYELKHGYFRDFPHFSKQVRVFILTDSEILADQMNNRKFTRAKHLCRLRDESQALLKEFGHWSVKWTPRKTNLAKFGH